MDTTYFIGQRVRTTVNLSAAWPGALSAPIGALGTITHLPTTTCSSYGVALDIDPVMPTSLDGDQITPA